MAGVRFGGRYSPGAEPETAPTAAPARTSFRNRRARRVSIRARLLFLLPLPLLFAGIGAIGRGDPVEMLAELGGFTGLMLSAWLLDQGQRASEAYAARTIAKPPAIPRKLFAAMLTGASIFAVGLGSLGQGIFGAAAFGIVAGLAHLAAFGLDPMRRKGLDGTDSMTSARVERALTDAERLVAETTAAASRIGDRRLEGRIERLCDQAREVFRAVEADPRDLSRARRFLSVYLLGLRDATVKFADLYPRARAPETRQTYEALIGDLETSFTAHRSDLLSDNRTELDIEIEVLRERLQTDGLVVR